MTDATIHHVAGLLTDIGGKVKSRRAKAATEISKIKLYPDVIPNASDFIKNYVTPILAHFDDDSDVVREKCVECGFELIKQLERNSLDNLYATVLPTLFARITKEEVEEISKLLASLLKYLIELCNSETIPSNFDAYLPRALQCTALKFKASDPKMKLFSCGILESLCAHSTHECLKVNASLVVPSMIPNIKHRQVEIRRRTLVTLGHFYVTSGSLNSFEKIIEMKEKLALDEKMAARIGLISFTREMLTQHPQRREMYQQLLIPVFSSLYSAVPMRPLNYGEKPKECDRTDESDAAFDALVAIGAQYSADTPGVQEMDIPFGDGVRSINVGLIRIVHENFAHFMDILLPMLNDWTSSSRILGFHATTSAIHIANEFAARFAPQIMPRLVTALKEAKDEQELILRCSAVFTSLCSGEELIGFLAPKITSEGPREIIELVNVSLVNASFEDESLSALLDSLLESRVDESTDCVEPLAAATMALITKSAAFRQRAAVGLATLILRIGERAADWRKALEVFTGLFDGGLEGVFGVCLDGLLDAPGKTPRFLTQLLLTAPPEAVAAKNDHVCAAIVDCLRLGLSAQPPTYRLVCDLCKLGAIKEASEQLAETVLDDMVWRSGAEYVSSREAATSALGALLKCGAISKEALEANADRIIPMTLSSLRDDGSDLVRSAAIVTMREIVSGMSSLEDRFERMFEGLRERLADPILAIRLGAAEILGGLISKSRHAMGMSEKLPSAIIFMDDGSPEMRSAIAKLCQTIASIDNKLKARVSEILAELVGKAYHPEAAALAREVSTTL